METKKVEREVYVAFDGKEFDDAQECKQYEQNARFKIKDITRLKLLTIPHVKVDAYDYIPGAGCEEELYIIKVRDEKDMENLQGFLDVFGDNTDLTYARNSLIHRKKKGTVDVLVTMYDDEAWCYGTIEEFVSRAVRDIYNAANDSKGIVGEGKYNILEYTARVYKYGSERRFIRVLYNRNDEDTYRVCHVNLINDEFEGRGVSEETITNFLNELGEDNPRREETEYQDIREAYEKYKSM